MLSTLSGDFALQDPLRYLEYFLAYLNLSTRREIAYLGNFTFMRIIWSSFIKEMKGSVYKQANKWLVRV